MLTTALAVAEVQGLYGPFSFAEKVLQKIWLRGDFDHKTTKLHDGRPLRIGHPGKWNLLGGPDFKGARLGFGDGAEITGDVELHLHASDWAAHGHAQDPAYDRVVLHVVLFPPEPGSVACDAGGHPIPLLVLLPLLPHDLEEFAADEAVVALVGNTAVTLPEELAMMPPEKLRSLLIANARQRWERKVHFASVRLERLGWEGACHHAALEVLGFRFNRTPMLRIAGRWPLSQWSAGAVETEAVFASEAGCWSMQGVRPANQPRARLRQYAAWTHAAPHWPELLAQSADGFPQVGPAEDTRHARRTHGFVRLRERLFEVVCGRAIGGTRLDTLICDGLFPLLAARRGAFDFGTWFHWFPGDQPPALVAVLRQLDVCRQRESPLCHGFGQGLFHWFILRDARG